MMPPDWTVVAPAKVTVKEPELKRMLLVVVEAAVPVAATDVLFPAPNAAFVVGAVTLPLCARTKLELFKTAPSRRPPATLPVPLGALVKAMVMDPLFKFTKPPAWRV